jgi:hypothetical protein
VFETNGTSGSASISSWVTCSIAAGLELPGQRPPGGVHGRELGNDRLRQMLVVCLLHYLFRGGNSAVNTHGMYTDYLRYDLFRCVWNGSCPNRNNAHYMRAAGFSSNDEHPFHCVSDCLFSTMVGGINPSMGANGNGNGDAVPGGATHVHRYSPYPHHTHEPCG